MGTFSVYGAKLHLFLCATNRMPPCYELTSAEVTEGSLSKELLAEAKLGEEFARKLLGDLAYRSLPERRAGGHLGRVGHPAVDRALQQTARRPPENRDHPCEHQARVQARGDALATTLVGLATQVAAKMTAYTYDAFLVNRRLGCTQGKKIKALWA